jgi:hypothetical protein
MQISFQKSAARALGTRKVQAPPVALRGSSQIGRTPRLNRWMLSRRGSRARSKLLKSDQKERMSEIWARWIRRVE